MSEILILIHGNKFLINKIKINYNKKSYFDWDYRFRFSCVKIVSVLPDIC